MQLRPSHQADDMGARLGVSSGFMELTRTTGVPKYRIAGSTTVCCVCRRRSLINVCVFIQPISQHHIVKSTRFLLDFSGRARAQVLNLPQRMRVPDWRVCVKTSLKLLLAVIAVQFAACAKSAQLPVSAGTRPNPTLPRPTNR